MKIAAVICEYNPFHNGHKFQIEEARQKTNCDAVVALISGNFVQRGDFAIYDKYTRAKAAISCGADLVIENPAHFVLRSAEGYASAGVATLSSLGCIDYLFFGSESDSLDDLKKLAEFFADESPSYKDALAAELAKGISFAKARSNAAYTLLGGLSAELLSGPNNLLAIEYLKAIIKQGSALVPILIQRKNAGHHETAPCGEFASASYIRGQIAKNNDLPKDFLPEILWDIYQDKTPFETEGADKTILSILTLMSRDTLANTPDISEGLENKIKNAVIKCDSLEELLDCVKSKRYAYSRLKRAILCACLGITKESAALSPQYIKILDFNEVGQKVLNCAKKSAALPLAKNASAILNNETAFSLWKKELEFDKVYERLGR